MKRLALSPSHPSSPWPAVLLRHPTPSALSHPTLAPSATPPAAVPPPQTPPRTTILVQSPQLSPPRQMSLPPKPDQRRRSQAQQLLTQFRRKTAGQARRPTSQLLTASFRA